MTKNATKTSAADPEIHDKGKPQDATSPAKAGHKKKHEDDIRFTDLVLDAVRSCSSKDAVGDCHGANHAQMEEWIKMNYETFITKSEFEEMNLPILLKHLHDSEFLLHSEKGVSPVCYKLGVKAESHHKKAKSSHKDDPNFEKYAKLVLEGIDHHTALNSAGEIVHGANLKQIALHCALLYSVSGLSDSDYAALKINTLVKVMQDEGMLIHSGDDVHFPTVVHPIELFNRVKVEKQKKQHCTSHSTSSTSTSPSSSSHKKK